jgi:hypothetical protein
MKLMTLLISARAYGVTTLLELAILEQLVKPSNRDPYSHRSILTLGDLELIFGDTFTDVAASAAHLEELGLIYSRKLFCGIRSIVIDLTAKGNHLMHGKPAPRKKSEKLGLQYPR